MTRAELLAPIVQTIRRGTGLPIQEIDKHLSDWEAVPITVDGSHVGTLIAKGTELHIALVPGYRPRGAMRGVIKNFLKPLFERQGFLTTRILHQEAAQHAFVKRVGFKPTWRCGQFQYYLLGALPFERKDT